MSESKRFDLFQAPSLCLVGILLSNHACATFTSFHCSVPLSHLGNHGYLFSFLIQTILLLSDVLLPDNDLKMSRQHEHKEINVAPDAVKTTGRVLTNKCFREEICFEDVVKCLLKFEHA